MIDIPPDEGYRAHEQCRLGKSFRTADGITLRYEGTVDNPNSHSLVTTKGDQMIVTKLMWGSEACFLTFANHRRTYK